MSVEARVSDAFKEALDLSDDADFHALKYREHPEWTSLGHMSLIAALEDRFDTMLDADDILAMSSYDKAIEIMKKYDVAT